MNPIPLDEIRWGWQDHKAALWWLGLLYRSPMRFRQAAEQLPWARGVLTGLSLYGHFLPYFLGLCALGRLLIFAVLQLPAEQSQDDLFTVLYFHGEGIAGGIAWGIAGGIVIGIVIGIALLRLYYHVAQPFFLWPTVHPQWYPYHPVAWDDLCAVPFWRLDRLLVAYAEHRPETGKAEIERLIASYPSQHMAALRAQATLLARDTARVTDLTQLDSIVARFPEGQHGFLAETPRVRELVREISALQTRLDTIDRPILREPLAQLLCTTIENFQHRIGGFQPPLAHEFRAAASQWLQIAQRQLQEAKAVLDRELTPQVFRAGDPVDRDQEAFVLRYSVVGELER